MQASYLFNSSLERVYYQNFLRCFNFILTPGIKSLVKFINFGILEIIMAKTYLSSDFKLNGNIKSQGDIEIDGQIKGKVVGNSVSVLASGTVDGSISGTSVSVDGKANGVISASDLAVASSGTVMADVTYETLSTDKGAKLQRNLKVK